MERTERLLDLVATLLDADGPLGLPRLRELFSDYRGPSSKAGERAFERDKAELAELGLPLRFVHGGADGPSGYVLDRDDYYLPDAQLRADEWALLYAAGGAALARGDFPGNQDLFFALRKLAFNHDEAPLPQFSDALAFTGADDRRREAQRARLEELWEAMQARKRVRFTYRNGAGISSRRHLDCYGVAFRRGQWIAVGHDTKRASVRTFRVDRMSRLRVDRRRPRTPDYAVPEGFRIDRHAEQQSWELPLHAPEEVVLGLDASLAPLAERLFPHAATAEEGTRVTLTVTNRDALIRQVLALGPRAQITAPRTAARRARDLLVRLERTLGPRRRP